MLFLPAAANTGKAQPRLLESEHAPRAGDSLTVQIVEPFSPGVPGRDLVWDLSGSGTYSSEPALIYDDEGCVTLSCLGSLFHYRSSGDTLLLCGLENRRVLAGLTVPLPIVRWPVTFGDSLTSPLTGGAVWCERTFMSVGGEASTSCDASGTMILPGGDTLRYVTRIHARRHVLLREADSVRTWSALTRVPPPA